MSVALKRLLCIKAILLLLLTSVHTDAQRYPFYNLNVESGLIQSQPRDLVQDKLGHLWIATLGGLSRYDGQRFTNYSTRDGLPDNMLYSVATDAEGNIWAGGQDGISRFDGRGFRHYTGLARQSNAANTIVVSIGVDAEGRVWFLQGSKLFHIFRDTVRQVKLPDSNALISAFLADGKTVWAARTGGVLYHYAGGKWDSLVSVTPGLMVYEILKDSRRRYWLATNAGLYTVDSGRVVPARFRAQPAQLPAILSLTEDRTGALWMGTNTGVIRLADSSLQYFNRRSGLSDNTFSAMYTDAEGNVWMASDGQGVFRYSGTQFTVVDESTGLPSGQVTSIETDRAGRIYIGTYDAGLYVYEAGVVTRLEVPIATRPVITALKYRNGSLWIGTRGEGLWRYNGKYFYTYRAEDGKVLSNSLAAMHLDDRNRLWLGFSNGAMLYENDSFKTVPMSRGVAQDFIHLGGDSVLIATTQGIKLYTGGTVYPFTTGTMLDSTAPQCFTLCGRQLWTGTSDNGIICYHLEEHRAFAINKSNGLESDFIYNITTDDDGNIWAGTGFGIHRVSIRADGQPSVFFYGKGHGIRGMESNHNAVLNMPDGSIWFGTTNGALHYKPQFQMVAPQPTSIVLQSVRLFGEAVADKNYYDSTDNWYNVPYGLRLPYKKNNITFTFHAISLSSNEQLRYRYRIDGLDAPWSEWSGNNTVTFSALPPGIYTFRVQAMALGASQDPKELTYTFEIVTPFHKTRWFKLAVLAGCILLGVTIQYLANLRKQNRQRLLERLRREEQNKVRQRTAEDFHDEVGNRLTRINVLTNVLRSKMERPTPETDRIIEKIQENTSQLYSGTRDILWSLKPSNDSLYEILHRIRDFGAELFQDTDIEFKFIGTDERWKQHILPLDVSRNLIMIFKEALNNTLKYSNTRKVKMEAWLRKDRVLQITLMDYGDGFDLHYVKKGHGIDNMHVRAKRIHGRLYIDSMKGKGTIITLTFRLPQDIPSIRG